MFLSLMLIKFVFLSENNVDAKYVFTVNYNYQININEHCRDFGNFSKTYITDRCIKNGTSVYFCNNSEKYYILTFGDKKSCNKVLEIIKASKE